MDPKLKQQVLREWTRLPTPDLDRAGTGRLSEVLPDVVSKLGLTQRVQQQLIAEAWPQLVGPDIAKHTQPTAFRHGVLTILVDNSVWLEELSRYHKRAILQKLSSHFQTTPIRDIIFRAG